MTGQDVAALYVWPIREIWVISLIRDSDDEGVVKCNQTLSIPIARTSGAFALDSILVTRYLHYVFYIVPLLNTGIYLSPTNTSSTTSFSMRRFRMINVCWSGVFFSDFHLEISWVLSKFDSTSDKLKHKFTIIQVAYQQIQPVENGSETGWH